MDLRLHDRRQDKSFGLYYPSSRTISLRSDLDRVTLGKAMVHECCHHSVVKHHGRPWAAEMERVGLAPYDRHHKASEPFVSWLIGVIASGPHVAW